VAEPVSSTYLSEQEASDMLHKYATEATRLRATLVITATLQITQVPTMAIAIGTLHKGPLLELLTVTPDAIGLTSSIVFDPKAAKAVSWGENRQVPTQRIQGVPSHQSGLIFQYEGYVVALFAESES
jgi:hypothetical protein